ncbi:MAG: hypothetical protein ACI35T_07550 [Alistipes sp.]
MKIIYLIVLMLCLDAGIGTEANAQNFWNKVKKEVKKEVDKAVNNQSQRPQSTPNKSAASSTSTVGQSDKAILNSCGLSDISLRPTGKIENGGKEAVAVGAIPTRVAEQVGWRDKLPAHWNCDNATLADICNKVKDYNTKRRQNPAVYQWNEVLAVVDADYNDMELDKRIEALETAAEAYGECKAVFADNGSSVQDKQFAARTLANALGNAHYKRAVNSSRESLYPLMKNSAAVETFRQAGDFDPTPVQTTK